jgi:hypothetical protein
MASIDVARESYGLFRDAGADHLTACAWLGNEDGETSFRIGVWGDHHTAFDPAQHHQLRRDQIALPPPKGCGINVLTASHADQIRAIIWEMSKGAYKHIWPELIAARTMRDKIAVFVSHFEQSGSQARDIARRTALGNYWLAQISDAAPMHVAELLDHDAVDGCACGIEHDTHTADHELPAPRGVA